jgi:tetratricopeptide (TPR) repeat protein
MDINQIITNLDNTTKPIEIKSKTNYIPLISISGITLLSFGGLILLKSKTTASTNITPNTSQIPQTDIKPTQVPKSIQHYLLTSQQFFTKALETADQNQKIDFVNKSIIAATDAIKEFPKDYRGYHQRGRIYQSLIDSKPELLAQVISDFSSAFKLNQNSAEISRDLATVYAKKGDAQSTITYLSQTINLEPTKAQNFYDLAKIQQQAGYFSDALTTYKSLLTLVTDPSQKTLIENEKIALEQIVAANPNASNNQNKTIISPIDDNPKIDSPTIQATDILSDKGLIIAAPETGQKIEVANQTDSNSLSGSSTLSAGQTNISISNSQINDTTQVYVTTIKGGKDKNLKITSKSNGTFTVGINSPSTEDITFKWWIIK